MENVSIILHTPKFRKTKIIQYIETNFRAWDKQLSTTKIEL